MVCDQVYHAYVHYAYVHLCGYKRVSGCVVMWSTSLYPYMSVCPHMTL